MRSKAAPVATGLIPILTLATFTNHLNVVAWRNPFLPFIALTHGIGIGLLGQVPALMLLLSALLGLVIGPLADRYGYRLTLSVCLLGRCHRQLGNWAVDQAAAPGPGRATRSGRPGGDHAGRTGRCDGEVCR